MNNELNKLKTSGSAIVALLCVIPIVSTIAFGAVDFWSVGLVGILTAALVVLWLRISLRTGEFSINTSTLQLPIIGLILIGIIQMLPFGSSGVASDLLDIPASNALSLDPYATQYFVIRSALILTYFAAALTFVNSRERMTRIAIVMVVFGSAMAFFAILQRLAGAEAIYGIWKTPHAIPFGSYVNQHHFAALMELLSGVTLGILFGHAVKRDKKLLLAIAAVLMGMAVIFTGSRGGLISYVGVAAFAALGNYLFGKVHPGHSGEHKRNVSAQHKFILIGGCCALFFIVIGSSFFLGGGEALLRGIGTNQADGDITSGRGHFWNVAIQIFLANPIIGAGLDSFGVAFSRYDTWHGLFRVEQAHNDYLQILADAGILGFACVAAFVYLFFRKATAAISNAHNDMTRSIAIGAAAGCLGILIHSFFDFPLRTYANSFFFFLLVALATNIAGRARHKHRSIEQ